jgi:protein-S-isoprenylcysteine O-methyltransferase Ste14
MVRFFDYYVLSALGCFLCLSAGRAFILQRSGVPVTEAHRGRTTTERIEDAAGVACLVIRSYETLMFALPLSFQIEPAFFRTMLISAIPLKIVGALLWAVALALYALALKALGKSWRTDTRSDSTQLITHGVFTWSRNPIYMSFLLINFGTFLLLGHLVFVLITIVAIVLLYRRIRREEKFLTATYGGAYRDYCSRVGRYVKGF